MNIVQKMLNIFKLTEFENEKLNDSYVFLNNQLYNQSMIVVVEFALLDRNIKKGMIQTGLGVNMFFGILLLILETLGNYLLFCVVWYEKFGMDSKKRTVTNQLLSRMIFALIFFNIFFMPLIFGALLIPYSEYHQGFYVTVFKIFCPNFCNFLL